MRRRILPFYAAFCIILFTQMLTGCGGGGGFVAAPGAAISGVTKLLLRLGFDTLAASSSLRKRLAASPHITPTPSAAQSATITVTGAGGQVNIYSVDRDNTTQHTLQTSSPFKIAPGPVTLDVAFYDKTGGASGGGDIVAEYKNENATLDSSGNLTFIDQSTPNKVPIPIQTVAAPNTIPSSVILSLTGSLTILQGTTISEIVEAQIPSTNQSFPNAQLAVPLATQPSGAPQNPQDDQYLSIASSGGNVAAVTAQGTPLTQAHLVPVTLNFAGSTLSVTFTVAPSHPVITSVKPVSGPVSTTVQIIGTGLANATAVVFNGTTAKFTNNQSSPSTEIDATVPAGATSGTITVTTPGGTATANFTVTIPVVPTITSISPTVITANSSVTITGTGFTGATAVQFNSVNAVSFTVNSDTSITAAPPANVTSGTLTVATPGGTATASFTVPPVPTITSFSPDGLSPSSVIDPNSPETITGTGFTGATAVQFNSVNAASFTVNSDTSITATTPANLTAGTITITTPGGTATSSAYTVFTSPRIKG